MKKTVIALGTIFVFLGIVVLSIQAIPEQTVNGKKYPYKEVENEWRVPSAYFKKGEILSLKTVWGSNWGWPPNSYTEINGQAFDRVKVYYVRFKETSTGNYTEFAVILIIPPPPYSPSQIYAHDRIEVTHNGGILGFLYYSEKDNYGNTKHYTSVNIGGIANYDGNYTVETELWWEGSTKLQNIWIDENNQTHTEWVDPDPPANLYLYKLTIETIYPYRSLLVASPVMIVAGATVFVWGSRKSKGRIMRKKVLKHTLKMKNSIS